MRSTLPVSFLPLLPLLSLPTLQASPALAAEPEIPETIRLQAGCFQVSYRFVEPGKPTDDENTVKEWIALNKKEGALALTHVGLFGGDPTWHFEEMWSRRPDGSWRQQVMGRSGPRYTCEGKFVGARLHCKAPGAAKPLRDKDRKDYDKLDRGISLLVRPQYWAQQEYNDKVKNDGTLVAVEVGLVEYKRLPDADCAAARKQFPTSIP